MPKGFPVSRAVRRVRQTLRDSARGGEEGEGVLRLEIAVQRDLRRHRAQRRKTPIRPHQTLLQGRSHRRPGGRKRRENLGNPHFFAVLHAIPVRLSTACSDLSSWPKFCPEHSFYHFN